MLGPQACDKPLYGPPARLAHNVPNEKQTHPVNLPAQLETTNSKRPSILHLRLFTAYCFGLCGNPEVLIRWAPGVVVELSATSDSNGRVAAIRASTFLRPQEEPSGHRR